MLRILAVYAAVSSILVVLLAFQNHSLKQLLNKNQSEEADLTRKYTIDTTGSPVMGPANAPIEIVTFSDFKCPHCKDLYDMLNKMVQSNDGDIRWVFKHAPMEQSGRELAAASIAAQAQGSFWEMADYLYNGVSEEKEILSAGETLGLNIPVFMRDRQSTEVNERLKSDSVLVEQLGIDALPTVFVNGFKIKGNNQSEIKRLVRLHLSKIDDSTKTR